MALVVYNTLTRQKEEFRPLREGHVGMYVCGPTVYSHSHIGHGKSYVSFDVIVRYLRYLGYNVLYVQNITDVGHLLGETNEGEDRMLKQSRIEQKHPMEVAEEYTRSYFEDMDALGVVRPNISPRATGHIIEQIELIKRLIEKGYAYEANGSVYFDVRKFPDYGKLSHRSLDEMVEGTRVEVRSEKRSPQDFALWKRAEPEHILRWPSPWGEGFPGWHIECSAMSMKYLGESFDIHGGGLDNQFPHHECEIAQSVCATGKPFVKYWLHNNLVTVGGQKMSKSLGNFVTLKDAFKKYDPLVIRFFILQSHYRSTLDFSDEALQGAKAGLEKLTNTVHNLRLEIAKAEQEARTTAIAVDLASYKKRFLDAMDDDFNSPQAIAVLFELSKEVNASLSLETKFTAESLRAVLQQFEELGGKILGVIPEKAQQTLTTDAHLEAELINLLIQVRAEARKQKLFALSDMIRDGLKKIGIVLEDKKDETVWKKSS
ncbi:MAG TPA: cysteine--tRNA ligase [Bacteroidota bacterium]|nr:cysteine--tRNA ligase [Bacteroidota bacterium]